MFSGVVKHYNTCLLTLQSQNVFLFAALNIWACVYYSPKFLVFSSVTKKVTQARKGLGTNSVGLATELSLVSKLLQKVIPKKIFAIGSPCRSVVTFILKKECTACTTA